MGLYANNNGTLSQIAGTPLDTLTEIQNDITAIGPVNSVSNGDTHAVTSNAVYNALPKIQAGRVIPGNSSTKKVIDVTFPKPFTNTPFVTCSFYTLKANTDYISEASVIVMDTTTTGFSMMVKCDQTLTMTTAVDWIAIEV